MDANFEYEPSIQISEDLEDYTPAIDTASLLVCNGFSTPVELFGQVDECTNCAFQSLSHRPIEPGDDIALALTSIYAYRLELRRYTSSSDSSLNLLPFFEPCRLHMRLEEYGAFVWNVGHHPNCGDLPPSSAGSVCEWRQLKAGSSSMTPLVVLLSATLVGLPLLCLLVCVLLRAVALRCPAVYSVMCSVASFMCDPRTSSSAVGGDEKTREEKLENSQQKKGRRVLSVDVLRGAAIVVMIFWGYGSGAYACLDHTIWNGIHLSDVAFPSFMFVMGVSLAITNCRDARRIREAVCLPPQPQPSHGTHSSTHNRLKRGVLEFAKLVYRFVWRSLILFVIGLALSNHDFSDDPDYSGIRIFSILQRLALTYLITGLATLPIFLRYAAGDVSIAFSHGLFWDLSRFWPEWIPILALVALQTGLEYGIDPANWNATSVASMTGCPRGYLGPGGLHWNGSYPTCTGGAHRLLDLWLLGEEHLDESPTTHMVYETRVPYEDDGLLGTCSSVLLCFLGLQAGKVLLFSRSDRERIFRWIVWTAFYGLLILPLVQLPSPYQFNESLLPINFSIW